MPVLYLPHGGGPWPFVDVGVPSTEVDALRDYLRTLPEGLDVAPKALLVISAHWEHSVPNVMTGTRPGMLYDYYGFPAKSYEIVWPAPGAPELATKVRLLLSGAGFETAADASRGFDHGTFVPMKVAFPDAKIPTIQLSLRNNLDPIEHVAIGRALAPLRDEGVLIVGSGMSFHNMRGFGNAQGASTSRVFDEWLSEAATSEPAKRNLQLADWARAPMARQAHPREEHLLPLMVAAGAAQKDVGRVSFRGTFAGATITAFRFG
ncbi:MAG TPA: class III extradiol ring-cleavage dioxygenase [Polyangiaceae bacterium]